LVEDRRDHVDALVEACGAIAFVVAMNRDDALAVVANDCFDLAICDLKIPPAEGHLAEVEHGLAVVTAIRELAPGTPIVAFTAYRTTAVLDLLLREQRREDFLGTWNERPMLSAVDKDDLLELVAELGQLAQEFEHLERIDVALGFGSPALDWGALRVLRIYARQRDCVLTRVERLSGGRSGIPVLRIEMEREDGSAGGSAVVRLAPVAAVEEERRRFQQRVSGVLPLGNYAEIMACVRAGAAGSGAVFYQVAEGAVPLFEIVAGDTHRAAAAVEELRAVQALWIDGAPATSMTLADVRRLLIADSTWLEVQDRCELSEIADLEAGDILMRRGTVHGDFHGGNILVAEHPVLIDFLSVTEGPTPLDPVALELSVLFHPDMPAWASEWPTDEQLQNWADLDAYVVDCPFEPFIRSCRDWAMAVARVDRDVLAAGYAYLASQARFESTDLNRLRRVIGGLADRLR